MPDHSDDLHSGERQVATHVDGIRADHVARYRFAARTLRGKSVLDIGCGIGYGARILAEGGGCTVTAVDRLQAAIEYAGVHYAHPDVKFLCGDVSEAVKVPADAAVCFEVIEHLRDPEPLLTELARSVPLLLVSAPNQEVFPWGPRVPFHFRHYTRPELEELLSYAGWKVDGWYGQLDKHGDVLQDIQGRTLVAVAVSDPEGCR
jgi:SAM-dependent methyltransferase